MPYLSCDDAFCDEKAMTGSDCQSDHWVAPTSNEQSVGVIRAGYLVPALENCAGLGRDALHGDYIDRMADHVIQGVREHYVGERRRMYVVVRTYEGEVVRATSRVFSEPGDAEAYAATVAGGTVLHFDIV